MSRLMKKVSDQDIRCPVQCSDLLSHVRGLQDNRGFEREFRKIPVGETGVITHAKKPNADEKNRYYFIFPFDHNRVKLDTSMRDYVCEGDDYVNASYSKSYNDKLYITAQAPLPDYIPEFWQMIWEQDCPRIVMLANLIDNGHINCNQYWPDEGTEEMEDFTVTNCGEEVFPYYTKRNLQVAKDGETKSVTQYQYTCWPDRSIPASCASILELRAVTMGLEDPNRGPTILHCRTLLNLTKEFGRSLPGKHLMPRYFNIDRYGSAGIGRTGTFLAIDYLIQQAEHESVVDVMACTHFLRKSRMNMIQNLTQYAYVYETILEAIMCKPGVSFSCEVYIQNNMQYKMDLDRVRNEYEVLEAVRERDVIHSCTEARRPENIRKNRDLEILPRDFAMLSLGQLDGIHSEYINGIFVGGYADPYEQLVTQMPLPHTVLDFWRLVTDYTISTIVMLNSTLPDVQYWPLTEGEKVDIGGLFSVTNTQCHTDHHIITTSLTVTFNSAGVQKSQHIKHYHFKEDISENVLHLESLLLQLYLSAVKDRSTEEREYLVHCLNGCERSGVFCCIDHIVKKIDKEKKVDVFNAVKCVRRSRPQFITSFEQYKCLWEIAELYLEQKTPYNRS